ncbi:MAG: DUF1385 domain-containing protein [Thermoleophilia bacterium]|jgi:uncharacterized protein YqhQ|nr:DUF1385 domain-containing protein [Thermoleophilia bacterium]MBJ7333732.1 DUF1385 domain-containing protein [Thermoleophilia bacterium]
MSQAVGGQAVVEGVMMRTPTAWAVAVRRPDGRITTVVEDARSIALRFPILRWPVIRGVVALGESLAIGMKALSMAARLSTSDHEGEGEQEIGRREIAIALVVAVVFSVVFFKVVPSVVANFLPIQDTFLFVVAEGIIRVSLFVGYLVVLSLLPDLRRVFQFHAAEHQAINALEAGEPRTAAAAALYSRIHLRCGTAFLLWVMVIAIIVFAFVGRPDLPWLIASRVLLVPVIAGIAYEVIRLAGRYGTNPIVHAILWPGLLLQRLTTRPADAEHLEVAVAALDAVLQREETNRAARPEAPVDVMA